MAKRSLLWTLSLPVFVFLAIAMALVTGFTGRSVRKFFTERSARELTEQARLMSRNFDPLVREDQAQKIQALSRDIGTMTGVRFTIIAPDGRVLGDSEGSPPAMENHASRPEVAEALAGHRGRSIRYSTTLDNKRLYVAVPAGSSPHNYVIRTSVSLASLNDLSADINRRIAVAGFLLFLVASMGVLMISRSLSLSLAKLRRGAERLATEDFQVDLDVGNTKEIFAVADAMSRMANRLEEQFETIAAERNELKAVLGSMVEGVLAIDQDEVVFGLNQAGAHILGIETEAAMGRTIQEVGRNQTLTAMAQDVLRDSKTREGSIELTIPKERWVQVHSTILHATDNRPLGALLVMNDITRLRRLENMRRDFVANVSHELKTPITAIKGFVETLLEDPPEDHHENQRFLTIISNQASRLGTIIADLLDLSRLEQETDQGTLEKNMVPLAPVLEKAVQEASNQMAQADGRLTWHCSGNLEAKINSRLIGQALGNLLANALKYSPEESPVTVNFTAQGDEIHLAVTDQGTGIPATHIPRLCERFYRVDKARSRQLGGTGLGLAIVKHIAQAHGGRIDIQSTLGAGSTFTLVLPREV